MSNEENDEENPATPLCSICEEPTGTAGCTGTTPHYLCDSCFCGYASAQFSAVGAFEHERTSSDDIVSAAGELPCYLFLTNECDCACIPKPTLARVLSTDPIALEAYESAKRRLIHAQHDREQAEAEAAEAKMKQESSAVDKLQQVVVEAMSQGGYVPCPSCGHHIQKKNACMHMKCPCGTRYCYCCGRQRGDGPSNCRSDGTGCDYPSVYMENHPGWSEYSLNGNETAQMGALHEFHRQRMAYFLRQVKSNYSAQLWEQLRQEHPDLLEGAPTDGRRIDWNEIDTARPPLFGSTTVDDLEWKDGGLQACTEPVVEEQAPPETHPPAERPRQDPQVTPPFWENHEGFVIIWVFGFLLAIILLSCRVVNDGRALRITGNILISILVATGLPLVAMWMVDYFAANPQQGCFSEVQCIRGRNNELPYLATEGRWSRHRSTYWFTFFGGIALASVCLASKHRPFSHAFGAFLLTEILLSYSGLTFLVNAAVPPFRPEFKAFMVRLWLYGALLSIGVGLLVAYKDSFKGNVAGKVFFTAGFAGALAELIPRVYQAYREEQRFTDTPSERRLVLS